MHVPSDTTREAHLRQVAALRRMTPEERVRIALEMSDQVRAMVRSGIRARQPHAGEAEVQRSLEELILRTASTPASRAPALARGR